MTPEASSPFDGLGLRIGGIVHLSAREAFACVQAGAVILDVRDGLERNGRSFAVEGVIEVPWRRIDEHINELPREIPFIVADCVGIHSKEVVRLLQSRGFERVANLNGGMADWESAALPIDIDHDEEMTGSCICQLRSRKVDRSR